MPSQRMRLVTGVVDQALSSLSNTLVFLAIARTSQPATYGESLTAFAGVVSLLSITRGAFGTMISLRAGSSSLSHETQNALIAATSLGLIGPILSVALIGHVSTLTLFVVSTLTFLLPQDVLRFHAIAQGRPEVALVSDAAWFMLSAGCLASTFLANPTATQIGLTWMLGAALALCLALSASRLPLVNRGKGFAKWLKADRGHRWRYGAEAGTASVSVLLLTACVSSFVGLTGTASLRGAATLIGPLNVLLSSAPLVLVPELRRRMVERPDIAARELALGVRKMGIASSFLAIGIGVAGWYLPPRWGEYLLGETWTLARPIIPLLALEYVGQTWLVLANTVLRTMNRSHDVLRIRFAQVALGLCFGVAAAYVSRESVPVALAAALTACAMALVAQAKVWRLG